EVLDEPGLAGRNHVLAADWLPELERLHVRAPVLRGRLPESRRVRADRQQVVREVVEAVEVEIDRRLPAPRGRVRRPEAVHGVGTGARPEAHLGERTGAR